MSSSSPCPYNSYKDIQNSWNEGKSSSDIYHRILDWIKIAKPDEAQPSVSELIADFMKRAVDGDSTNDLVEDFIYGKRYVNIRNAFETPQ